MPSGLVLRGWKENPFLHLLAVEEWVTLYTANVGGDRFDPGITILPLESANGPLEGRMSGER